MVTNEGIKINKPVEKPIENDTKEEEIDFSIEFDGNNKGEK